MKLNLLKQKIHNNYIHLILEVLTIIALVLSYVTIFDTIYQQTHNVFFALLVPFVVDIFIIAMQHFTYEQVAKGRKKIVLLSVTVTVLMMLTTWYINIFNTLTENTLFIFGHIRNTLLFLAHSSVVVSWILLSTFLLISKVQDYKDNEFYRQRELNIKKREQEIEDEKYKIDLLKINNEKNLLQAEYDKKYRKINTDTLDKTKKELQLLSVKKEINSSLRNKKTKTISIDNKLNNNVINELIEDI